MPTRSDSASMDNQTLRQWLRIRPATLGIFEDLTGCAVWSHLDDTLIKFCGSMGLEVSEVHRRLIATAPITGLENWLSKPLYHLVDHLSAAHESFREHDLPCIEQLLVYLKLELGHAPGPAVAALADFQTFRREFVWHLEEEESFLFPKILRTEACLRHPELYPDVFKGSVEMFPPALMRLPDQELQDMLTTLTQNVWKIPLGRIHAKHLQEILSSLLSYGSKLKAHTYLESEILFKRAIGMEGELRQRAAHRLSVDNSVV
ncbi:MAG: hypothetical protein JWO30_162 [Fibrobacteres bacterium]|nr:hypothetical protein [Fibrobacterota bacterium]